MRRTLLSSFCRWHGRQVASCPAAYIILPVVAVIALACGIFGNRLTIDTDANKIWVPPGSTTAQQKSFFDAAFDPFYRVNQVIITVDGSLTGAGILQQPYLQAVFALQQALVIGVSNSGINLADVCFRPIPDKGCLIETPLDFFKSNGAVIAQLTPSDIQAGLACRSVQGVGGIPCQSSIGVPVQSSVVLGGAGCPSEPIPGINGNASLCEGCNGTAASSLILTFLLKANPDLEALGAEWERDVFLPAVANFSYPGLRVSYMAERSISDELARVDVQNQGVVLVSYAVMLMYVALALGKTPHPVASRALLGLQGVLIVAAAVAGALGAVAWAGMHITMICLEVVPFLILAIGVDNVFILTKAVDRVWMGPVPSWKGLAGQNHGRGLSAAEALQEALAEVGPTITAAALGEVGAFTVGITTNIPALRQFCIVAAVAVAIDYFLQVTWFAAAAFLDLKRQESGRADLLPCFVLRAPHRSAFEGYEKLQICSLRGRPAGLPSSEPLLDADESILTGSSPMLEMDRGLLQGYTTAKGEGEDGEEQEEQYEDTEISRTSKFWRFVNRGGFVHDFLAAYWAPFVLWGPVRVLIVLLWVVFLGLSLWAAAQLPLGLEQQLVLPTGSYLSQFFTDQAKLGDAGPPMYVVLQNVNYSHPNASAGISTLVNTLASRLPDVLVPPVFSWVGDFDTWDSDTTRKLIAANPLWRCPLPLDPADAPIAARVAQFVFGIPIDSICCQAQGYCGGQYASDIKFLWGVPKVGDTSDKSLFTSVAVDGQHGAVHVTKTGFQTKLHRSGSSAPFHASAGSIDDGGCDLASGYLLQSHVVNALDVDQRMGQLVQVDARALPVAFRSKLAPGLLGSGDLSNITLIPCHIMTSRLRGQHTPLRNQSDYILSMQKVQAAVNTLQGVLLPVANLSVYGIAEYSPLQPGSSINGSAWTNGSIPAIPIPAYADDNAHTTWLPPAPGGAAFPYSLIYVYYEQYGYIRGVAVANVMLAVGAIYLSTLLVTSPVVAAVTTLLVASVAICMAGWVWLLNPHGFIDPDGGGPYGVDVNAVSVVNAVTATGLSVEFIIHIAAAYFAGIGSTAQNVLSGGTGKGSLRQWCSSGARRARFQHARVALLVLGAPVVTGITLTKLVGVTVLATAPSALFRLYYFRMYLGIIVLGAFHGLALLPALLAC